MFQNAFWFSIGVLLVCLLAWIRERRLENQITRLKFANRMLREDLERWRKEAFLDDFGKAYKRRAEGKVPVDSIGQ